MGCRSIANTIASLLGVIRIIYIVGALIFVGYTYYTTILLAKQQNLIIKEEVRAASKYLYPSITFCYVFKNDKKCSSCNDVKNGTLYLGKDEKNGKHVRWLYYLHYIRKWKETGMYCLMLYLSFGAKLHEK